MQKQVTKLICAGSTCINMDIFTAVSCWITRNYAVVGIKRKAIRKFRSIKQAISCPGIPYIVYQDRLEWTINSFVFSNFKLIVR